VSPPAVIMSSAEDQLRFGWASASNGRSSKRSHLKSDSSDTDDEVVSNAKVTKTTGLDEILFVGTEDQMAKAYGKPQSKKAKTTAAANISAKTPTPKKARTPQNPPSKAISSRDRKWESQYSLALEQYNNDKFASIVSGERVYNWMDQAKTKVDLYDKNAKKCITPEEHDKDCGSSGWKSHNINKACPLVEAFKLRRNSRATRLTDLPRSRQMSNDRDFFKSAIHLHWDARCMNSTNQDLYRALENAAALCLEIGADRNNHGHYQTGKDWCYVGRLILNVSHCISLGRGLLALCHCVLTHFIHVVVSQSHAVID